jgi:holo-[acyl-carrier protein] synthase
MAIDPDGPGLGIDVVEIDRLRRAVNRHGERFLSRIFTREEIAYCVRRQDPAPSLAARFAAKEAFAKAAPRGADPTWQEVEVVMGAGNRPGIRLAPRLAAAIGGRQILVTLSHSRDVAVAAVLIS